MSVQQGEATYRGLNYRIEGPQGAPVVVLSHAISTSLRLWDLQVPVWSKTFRIVRFDLRGHGQSEAPRGTYGFAEMADDVLGLLDHIGIDRAAFVGLSIGGMIGQAVALKAPQRLSALILAETNAKTPPNVQEIWRQRMAAVRAGGMETQVEGSMSRWFTAGFRAQAPLTVAWIADLLRATNPLGYIACSQAVATLDHFDRLGEIRVPTLAIAGAEDPAAPPANLQAIAARIPGAHFAVLENAAHLGNIEQATAFTERVGAFLLEHAPT